MVAGRLAQVFQRIVARRAKHHRRFDQPAQHLSEARAKWAASMITS